MPGWEKYADNAPVTSTCLPINDGLERRLADHVAADGLRGARLLPDGLADGQRVAAPAGEVTAGSASDARARTTAGTTTEARKETRAVANERPFPRWRVMAWSLPHRRPGRKRTSCDRSLHRLDPVL